MELSLLLQCLPSQSAPAQGLPQPVEAEITALTVDSRQAKEGVVFVAIRGEKNDGHQFLPTVCAQGASAVIVEDMKNVPPWYWGTVVHVKDTRKALDLLATCFYHKPSRELFCVGITGTNGKTTTTHIVEYLLNEAKIPTGVIGTINHHLGSHVWPTTMTTPDPVSLQMRLREFASHGAKALAMEVSSHALKQARADSVEFDTVVFTNFTRDHLDYHKTMQDYFESKQRLFCEVLEHSSKPKKTAIWNADDPEQAKLKIANGVTQWSYGMSASAHFRFTPVSETFQGSRFQLDTPLGSGEFEIATPGRFNLYNAVAAIAVGASKGLSLEQMAHALKNFRGVPGRLESVANARGLSVFVDYAHTDDALMSVLKTLHAIRASAQSSSRIITVFGCGGDRDPGKRPLMMRAARSLSDLVIVTSDNPRTEDPQRILDDVLSETDPHEVGEKLLREVDRKKAIALACSRALPGDVILIAGKGHEDYQIIGTEKIHFSDQEVVREILK